MRERYRPMRENNVIKRVSYSSARGAGPSMNQRRPRSELHEAAVRSFRRTFYAWPSQRTSKMIVRGRNGGGRKPPSENVLRGEKKKKTDKIATLREDGLRRAEREDNLQRRRLEGGGKLTDLIEAKKSVRKNLEGGGKSRVNLFSGARPSAQEGKELTTRGEKEKKLYGIRA